jgi:glyoxylate utilization-related uncharacterized protein
MAEFPPGPGRSPFVPESYTGVEMVFVVSGSLLVTRKGEPHTLGPGDVLYISGETARTYRASGHQTARALIISFDQETIEPRRASRIPAPARAPLRAEA